ncbi:MAG: NAD(+) synthase, partial [Candidatus Kapaibacterium sp.]
MKINLRNYNYLRVFNACPEVRVADVDFNTEHILSLLQIANKEQADICLFPELAISSYSCNDLFFNSSLLDAVELSLEKIKIKSKEIDALV